MGFRNIAIHGKIGSGKDTLGDLLTHELGAERRAFGDAAKLFTALLCALPVAYFYSRKGKATMVDVFKNNTRAHLEAARYLLEGKVQKYRMTVEDAALLVGDIAQRVCERVGGRATCGVLLQQVATETKRHFGQDVWVEKTLPPADHPVSVVFTDLRCLREYEELLAMGTTLFVKVVGDPLGVRAACTRDTNHSSETELDGIDVNWWIVDNEAFDPEMKALREAARSIADAVRSSRPESCTG
jgi:hypothetical protein